MTKPYMQKYSYGSHETPSQSIYRVPYGQSMRTLGGRTVQWEVELPTGGRTLQYKAFQSSKKKSHWYGYEILEGIDLGHEEEA